MRDTPGRELADWRAGLIEAAARIFRVRRRRPTPSVRPVFVRHYEQLKALAAEPDQDGFLIAAAGSRTVEGVAWLPVTREAVHAAMLGRHKRCDISLPDADDLSLRHLALIAYPREGGTPAPGVLRLVDLRTSRGMMDEQGGVWQALETDGPVVVRCASRVIFALPAGPTAPRWPREAGQGWEVLSRSSRDRTGEDRSLPTGAGWKAHAAVPPSRSWNDTLVLALPGPQHWHRSLLEAGEEPCGALAVASEHGEARLVVGSRALARGILLGRADNCDNDGVPVLRHRGISRVHALVIRVAGAVHLIDTASTNGAGRGSDRVRLMPLTDGRPGALGYGLASVSWSAVH